MQWKPPSSHQSSDNHNLFQWKQASITETHGNLVGKTIQLWDSSWHSTKWRPNAMLMLSAHVTPCLNWIVTILGYARRYSRRLLDIFVLKLVGINLFIFPSAHSFMLYLVVKIVQLNVNPFFLTASSSLITINHNVVFFFTIGNRQIFLLTFLENSVNVKM